MSHTTFSLPAVLTAAFLISGCGGSSSSDSDLSSGDSGSDAQQLSGIVLSPEQGSEQDPAAQSSLSALQGGGDAGAAESCPGDVPSGYQRVKDTAVELFDASGGEVESSLQTNDCGVFAGEVSLEVSTLRIAPDGLRPIEGPTADFAASADSTPTVVSTISETADYEIRSFFRQSDGRFGFTVADTETGRPVIGMPADAFTIEHAGTALTIENVRIAQRDQEGASVVLALDASGSMDGSSATVYSESGEDFYRWHVARTASHLFLDEKGAQDETAVLIFDADVDLITDRYIEENLTVTDASGADVPYVFSESGFTSSADDLRLVIDAYSRWNSIYEFPRTSGNGANPEPHPDTPDLTIASYVRSTGWTALYDGVHVALEEVSERANARKAVVTMGDGQDNTSSRSESEVVDYANSLGIPVFSIALGLAEGSTGFETLKAMGEDTGGDFVAVDDQGAETELLNAFQSIQTGLVFQYLLSLASPGAVQGGDTLTLKLDYNGVQTEDDFTIPMSNGAGSS